MKTLLTLLLILQVSIVQAEEQTYTFGIVPQQSAKVLASSWGPILRRLGDKTGLTLQFRTAPNIPSFEERVTAGEYDFAYMNPVHYTVFAEDPGYRALAKQKGKLIKGIIVTPKDSPLAQLEDLAGQTIAFPAPAAFAASVLPRGMLSEEGIEFTPKYVGSHDSVYQTVAKGLYPAGGGIQRTLATTKPEIAEQLKVFWTTRGFTPHAFAAHPRVPAEVVASVQQAMVDLFDDPEGQAMLVELGFDQGIEKASDADWDDVRTLGYKELPQ